MQNHSVPYVGNGAYCYANSTAMLLSAIGETTSPSRIEVLSGVGLGSCLEKESSLVYFSNLTGMPDIGISKALDILGFSYVEKASQEAEPDPFEELSEILVKSPVLLGPLDMSYLSYNPRRPSATGIDHYILALGIDSREIHLHDPAGFPHVSISLEQLKPAWKAESISYRRNFYRYWASPKRIEEPTEEKIYNQALRFFKSIYQESENEATGEKWIIGREAILTCARRIRLNIASQDEIDQLTHFALPLGAKRALDFASFFDFRDVDLALLKRKQATVFGQCQTKATESDWDSVAGALSELADIEEEFRIKLLTKK